jgi:hypothetical protein
VFSFSVEYLIRRQFLSFRHRVFDIHLYPSNLLSGEQILLGKACLLFHS